VHAGSGSRCARRRGRWIIIALILIAVAAWVIYRIVKGWLALADNKPMYLEG